MRDRAPIWIGLSDLLLCVLSVVIVAVAPHAKAKGPEQKAEFLITLEWNVDVDADVDLWVVGPSHRPVMYAHREDGCATLDRDSRGFLDNHVTLPDATIVKVDADKETVTLRCIEPGHFDVGAHMYLYRDATEAQDAMGYGLKVHVEVMRLNPVLKIEYAGDVVLDRPWQFVNAVSFDLSAAGALKLVSPPLEAIADGFFHTGGRL